MNCEFECHDDGWCRCKHCPNKLYGSDPSKMRARCRSGDSIHRTRVVRSTQSKRDTVNHPCIYQAHPTGEVVQCGGCDNRTHALFGCDLFATCLPLVAAEGRAPPSSAAR